MTRLLHDDVLRRLRHARDYLHAHYAERLVLATLASQAGISRYHFLRLFREAFGATPHQYLIQVRIERAKTLLAAEQGSVTDVCFDVGFSSLGSFSALFTERVGRPASAWRRRIWQVAQQPYGLAPLVIPWCFWNHYGDAPASARVDDRIATFEKHPPRRCGSLDSERRTKP
jgi:AraC-like DNA-binding protein